MLALGDLLISPHTGEAYAVERIDQARAMVHMRNQVDGSLLAIATTICEATFIRRPKGDDHA